MCRRLIVVQNYLLSGEWGFFFGNKMGEGQKGGKAEGWKGRKGGMGETAEDAFAETGYGIRRRLKRLSFVYLTLGREQQLRVRN